VKLHEIKDITGEKITKAEIKGSHKKLAKRLGVKPANLKDMSDSEIETILKDLGKHDFVDASKFDKKQIAKGIRIEYEHTNSKLVARLITLDHLAENPKYYDYLEKMEKSLKK
jgi:hypothetical protein